MSGEKSANPRSTIGGSTRSLDDTIGLCFSLGLHLFGALLFIAASAPDETVKEDPMIVEMVALTALGDPPKAKALPRIVAPPPPPEESSVAASISREVIEKPKDKPQEKPKEKPKDKPKSKPTPKTKRSKERKISKSDLFSGLSSPDPRADKGPRRGDRRGSIEGTSTQWNDGMVNAYISRVSRHIRRHFKPPASIDKRKLSKMSVEIYVKLKSVGAQVAQITNTLSCQRCSGNKFFDDAALRALKAFTVEGGAKLPLPKSESERKAVLKRGFSIILTGRDMM